MTTRLTWVLAVVAVSAICGCRPQAPADESAEDPPAPVHVQAVPAVRTTLQPTIDLVGTVRAIPECTAVVASQTSGWVEKVAVVDGATVAAGSDLVLLDLRLADATVAKAAAAVAEKEAALARLNRGYLSEEIAMARHDFERAQQQATSLRNQWTALTPLWQKKEIPDLQYQKAKLALEAAESTSAAAAAKLKLYVAGTPKEEIAEAQALLETAQSELQIAKLNREFCRIITPIEGTITQLQVRKGMYVDRATQIATVTDMHRLFVELRVPVERVGNLQVGARVDVSVTGDEETVIHGSVKRISGQADANTGDLVAQVEVTNKPVRLRPGMACRSQLWLPPVRDVVAIPVTALADRSGTPVVTVATGGKAREVEVVPGARTRDLVEIRQGVTAGQTVVTKGGYGLPDGCPVTIDQP